MSSVYEFGPFRLEVAERRLLREGTVVSLRPKVFDTLCALVERHGHLVTKGELFACVWPDTVVEENNLALNITVLRKALQTVGSTERFIETVSGKGYRFVAPVRALDDAAKPLTVHSMLSAHTPLPALVERDAELRTLRAALERAASGHRQVLCLSGEAGIGKTALLNRFLYEARAHPDRPLIGRGQAIEYVGAGEAYMPVLDALTRMCHEDQGANVINWLTRCAPTWLMQLPSVIADEQVLQLRERTLGSTPERMVREMVDLLERISEQYLVILALEDLHWSDPSTLSLIAALARRQEAARLLLAVTHRSGERGASGRSFEALAHDLELRGQGTVVRPGLLSEAALAEVVGERFPGLHVGPELLSLLRDRTAGNPLFVEALIDYWRSSNAIRPENGRWRIEGPEEALRQGVPDTLRGMLQRKLEVLTHEDEDLVECASVIGTQFSAELIASSAKREIEQVEARCSLLVREGLLRDDGICCWPDGVSSAQYRFSHALYQEVLYERVPPVRRGRLHQAIGRRLEAAYRERAEERASELAHHFSAGRDHASAVRYLQTAAENALRRSAHREAAAYLRRGLDLVGALPDGPERQHVEFRLHALLAPTALALEGFASPVAERSFARARELGAAHGNDEELLPLLYGLAMMHELRGEYSTTESVLNERLKWRRDDDSALVDSEPLMACSMFHQGRFSDALDHAENGARLYDPTRHLALIAAYGENPGVACLGWAALSLWFLGCPDRAAQRIASAVELSEAPGHLYSLSAARTHGAHVHQLRRDLVQTREWADRAMQVSEAQGYSYNVAFAMVLRGWAGAKDGARDEGLALMQAGLDRLSAMSAQLDRPYLLALLAETQIDAMLLDQAAATLDEAFDLVGRSRAFFYEAELFRLRASLLQQRGGAGDDPEALLRKALAVARRQGARSLQLRAATDLACLLMERGAVREARRLLQPIHRTFHEGFDTSDMVRASNILEAPMQRK
jgi:DNA-binding winged helix-turn-helix (wHTH) protein/tetratricopeptide (TPR) repeat protein